MHSIITIAKSTSTSTFENFEWPLASVFTMLNVTCAYVYGFHIEVTVHIDTASIVKGTFFSWGKVTVMIPNIFQMKQISSFAITNTSPSQPGSLNSIVV
ncbi:hypothetical protein GQX74_005599 [Glossina fuscipes]|nr:hypothetical protein GQX74_005599 [Glossina fuscipes]